MNIAPNIYNIEKRIEYALACFKERNPVLADKMEWYDIEVRMSHRLRRCAGRCMFFRKLDRFRVEFSESMFANMTEMEKTGTVSHELAHAVAFRLGVADNHDTRWKSLCRDMGGDGDRLLVTQAPVQKNVVKRVVLADKDSSYALSIRTKMQAERLLTYKRNLVALGSIAINYNDKTYRWASVINDDVKAIKVLKEALGWKLVG
jgi:hypothetical protein